MRCEVKVSLSGQFDLPENSELVSAVYWVYSPHLFLEPLTMEIQHCAAITTPTQCAQLTFICTKCTQKEMPYSLKNLMGSHNRETITSDFEDVTDKFHIQKTVYGCH